MNQVFKRKYTMTPEKFPANARQEGAALTQGYLTYDPVVRVRLSEDDVYGEKAWVTVKGPGTVERNEFEYKVPPADARELLKLCPATVTKTRYRIKVAGREWHVDEYTGPHAGLWLGTVELDAADQKFEQPAWASADVSDDPRYADAALTKAGRAP